MRAKLGMNNMVNDKKATAGSRELKIYADLIDQKRVNKRDLAQFYDVSAKTIQRDLAAIRSFLRQNGMNRQLVTEGTADETVYRIRQTGAGMSRESVLALCKVTLASRGLDQDEMNATLSGLLSLLEETDQKIVTDIIANEWKYYRPLTNSNKLLDRLWQIGEAIQRQNTLHFVYRHASGKTSEENLLPHAIMFWEFYFYVVGFTDGEENENYGRPYFYRVDRFEELTESSVAVDATHLNRFEDGKNRQKMYLMRRGFERTIEIEFTGTLEIVQDHFEVLKSVPMRSSTGELIGHRVTFRAYDGAAMMWLLSQGTHAKVISPTSLKNKMQAELAAMVQQYQDSDES